jgi:hypothetical protein
MDVAEVAQVASVEGPAETAALPRAHDEVRAPS